MSDNDVEKIVEKVVDFYHADQPYWPVNKTLCRAFGSDGAILLAELMSKKAFLEERKLIDKDGWFYNFQWYIKMETGISEQIQSRLIKKFSSLGIINVQRRKIPARNFYKIDYKKIYETCSKFNELNPKIYKNKDSSSINLIDQEPLEQSLYKVINKESNTKENKFLSKDKNLVPDLSLRDEIVVQSKRPSLTLAKQDKRNTPEWELTPEQDIPKQKVFPIQERVREPDPVNASQDAIDVVNHWNTKGKIFREHKRFDTKGIKKVFKLLDSKVLPQYGYAAVKGAIDRAAQMAHDKGLFTKAPRYKMSLPDFFMNESARFSKNPDKTPWFRRLLGEGSELKFLRNRDRNPETTAKIKDAYERYTTHQRVAFSPKQEVQFRMAAERLQEYRGNGDRLGTLITGAREEDYVRVLFEALANSRKDEDSSDILVGQLCSDFTWNSVLPRYLTKMYS